MRRRMLWFAALLTLLLGGCKSDEELDVPEFEPTLIASADAVVWQGLTHDWLYNHRWGRLGSGFVRTDPGLDAAAYPLRGEIWEPQVPMDRSIWTYMGSAGAGTGKDIGTHTAHGVRIRDAAVAFASMTDVRRITGPEGEVIRVDDWRISAALPAELVGAERIVAVLNGFWMQAVHEEAKQPTRLALQLGEGGVIGENFEIDVTVEFAADCDTPECDGCFTDSAVPMSDTVQYDLYVGVLLIGGAASAFGAERFDGPAVAESWDGPPALGGDDACLVETDSGCLNYWLECSDLTLADYAEMSDDAGRESVQHTVGEAHPVGTVAITGFELSVDEAHHMIGFDASATDIAWGGDPPQLSFRQNLRYQNWRHGMNAAGQDAEVLSVTSYGVQGSYSGVMRWVALHFAQAELGDESLDETIITEVTQLVIKDLDG